MSHLPPTPSSARASAKRRAGDDSSPTSARRTQVYGGGPGIPLSGRRASTAYGCGGGPLSDRYSSSPQYLPEVSSRRARDDYEETSTPRRMRQGVSSSARRMSMREISNANSKAMKVYIRVRPFNQRELANSSEPHSTIRIDSENPTVITTLDTANGFRPLKMYTFARCFWSVFDTSTKAENIRKAVDTYVNIPLPPTPSERSARPRGGSMVSMSGLSSARNNTGSDGGITAPEPPSFSGAGARAVTMDVNVSHPPYAGQSEIYRYVGKPILDNVVDGFNGCIFAYGQTGSGKTFTMMGYAQNERRRRRGALSSRAKSPSSFSVDGFGRTESPSIVMPTENDEDEEDDIPEVIDSKSGVDPRELQGIIPRICSELFSALRGSQETDERSSYLVEASYYEIYRERVFDLIAPQNNQLLKIREHPTKGPFVEKLSKKSILNEDSIARVIKKGIKERHTQATKFNDFSSRSHAILTVTVTAMHLNDDDSWETKTVSKLNLVDLAGSERTGLLGGDIKEDSNINLSLTTLGRVIDALSDISQGRQVGAVPPFRESNLTWLLSDSIGGNSLTSMIATISPHVLSVQETIQTLRYAARAREITLRPTKNEDPQVLQIKALLEKVDRLTLQLKEAGGQNFTETEFRELQKRVNALERKCGEQELIIARLRGELEQAGIKDPTVGEGFAESAMTGALQEAKGHNEEQRRRLEEAHRTISALRMKIEESSNIPPAKLAEMNATIAAQEKKIAALTKANANFAMVVQHYVSYADTIFTSMTRKDDALLDGFANALSDARKSVLNDAAESTKDWQKHLEDALRNHRQAVEEERRKAEARVKDAEDIGKRQVELLEKRHMDALAMVEDRMKRSKELHEQDLKRLEHDKSELQRMMSAQLEKAKEQYSQELQRLQARFGNDSDAKLKVGDEVRKLKEQHDKEMSRLTDDFERALRGKENELARMTSMRENEALRRESDLMEKDRQQRLLSAEIADLNRKILKIYADNADKEAQYKDDIMELQIRLDQLYKVSNSALGDWENKSADTEAAMCNLRALMYDRDYLNFRQKMRARAYTEPQEYAEKLKEIEARERLFKKIVSDAMAKQDELNRYVRSAGQNVREKMVIRGTGLNGSNPPSHQSTPLPGSITPTVEQSPVSPPVSGTEKNSMESATVQSAE